MPAVQISQRSYQELERIVRQSSQYETVDDLTEFILSAVVRDEQTTQEDPGTAVTERLKALGYL
jgi:hypothetical protein